MLVVLLVLCTVCLACGWSGVLLCCCVCLRLGMCGLIAFGWIWVANVLPVGLGSLGMGTVKEDSHAGGYWLSCAYARSGVWLGVFGKYQRLHLLPAICVQDSLAERSKAVAQGAIPKGRGFEPHSCHLDDAFMIFTDHQGSKGRSLDALGNAITRLAAWPKEACVTATAQFVP